MNDMDDKRYRDEDIKQAAIRERADAIWLDMARTGDVYIVREDAGYVLSSIFHAAALHRDDEAELGRQVLQTLDRIVLEEASEQWAD